MSVVSFRKQKWCLLHLSGCPRREDVVFTMCLTQDRKTYGVLSQVTCPAGWVAHPASIFTPRPFLLGPNLSFYGQEKRVLILHINTLVEF